MSLNQQVEEFYKLLDESSSYIATLYNKPYLEALIDTAEQFFQGDLVLEAEAEAKEVMQGYIRRFEQWALTKEELRRGMQWAIVKGIKEESIFGTGVTPDTVAMFIAYLATKLNPHPKAVLDPAVGTANLFTALLNQYPIPPQAYALEVDSLLIRLAYVNTNLQEHQVELFHQDALKTLFTEKAELIVCDLPIGVYPNQQVAKTYQLYIEERTIYTHHLLIEQSLRLTAEGGYLLFLIPETLFVEDGAEPLRRLITEEAYIQALLQLPHNLFEEGSILKSIFVLQKKGPKVSRPKQTLIASLPSFSDTEAFSKVLTEMNAWLTAEKGVAMV